MANPKRLLIIDKLVVAVPDAFGHDENTPVTIDEALQFLLDYRKSGGAVMANKIGRNFSFCVGDFPDSTNPEMKNYTLDLLVQYLQDHPEKVMAGMISTVIWDPDFQAYRNAYEPTDEALYQERKQQLLSGEDKDEGYLEREIAKQYQPGGAVPYSEKPASTCDGCEQLYGETCPDDPRVKDGGVMDE